MKISLQKITGIFLSVLAMFLSVVTMSHAALSAAVAPAFAQLQTDALALVDLAWTVAIPVAVAFIILRLFKKAAGSAT